MLEPKHRTKWSEPLVVISGEALEGAIKDAGITVAELARRVGDHPQTISHHVGSKKNRKCRASRRARWAKALEVPEEMLSGEHAVAWGVSWLPGSYEILRPPRVRWAASRLLIAVTKAFDRDMRDPDISKAEHADWVPFQSAAAQMATETSWSVESFLIPTTWRDKLLVPASGAWPRRPIGLEMTYEPLPPGTASEEDRLGLIRGIAFALRPWLDGKERLDYRMLGDLAVPGRGCVTEQSLKIPRTSPYAIVGTWWGPLQSGVRQWMGAPGAPAGQIPEVRRDQDDQ